MPDDKHASIELRPWSPDDLDLTTALLGDPAMTEHLGGPESPEVIRKRLDNDVAMTPADGQVFVITIGAEHEPAGSVAYWPLCRRLGFALIGQDRFEYPKGNWMTCNDWSLDLRAWPRR